MRKYIACICEGGAERAVLDLLLENHKLIFEREDLIEEEVLRCRNGKHFEERYLRKGYSGKITVYRVLDSRRENFNVSKAYENKLDVINIITAPEIEILIILNEGKYADFKKEYNKSGIKPSEYCRLKLRYNDVKKYEFVREYFSDINTLMKAMQEYCRVTKRRKDEQMMSDILK